MRVTHLCLSVVILLIKVTHAKNPGLRVQITHQGIDYAAKLARRILQEELPKMQIPSKTIDIHDGQLSLSNIDLNDFVAPQFSHALIPDSEIKLMSHGGHVSLTSDWSGWHKIAWLFKMRTSGQMKATASSIGYELTFDLSSIRPDSVPTLHITHCSANIEHLSVHIYGGVIPWVLNLFHKRIERKMKKVLESKMCHDAANYLLTNANELIACIPFIMPISDAFFFHYGLTSTPSAAENAVSTEVEGEVTWNKHRTPLQPHNLPSNTIPSTAKMMYLSGSDYILNSFLYSAHKANKTRFYLSPDMFPADLNESFEIDTSCDDETACMGPVIQKVANKFPNASFDGVLKTLQPPTVGTLHHVVENVSVADHAFGVHILLNSSLVPYISSGRVVANFSVQELRLEPDGLTDVAQEFLDMMAFLLKQVLEGFVQPVLAEGFTIPAVSGFSFRNVDLRLRNGTVEMGTDLETQQFYL